MYFCPFLGIRCCHQFTQCNFLAESTVKCLFPYSSSYELILSLIAIENHFPFLTFCSTNNTCLFTEEEENYKDIIMIIVCDCFYV